MVQPALVAVIFVATVGALYLRPPRVKDWHIAGIGAVAAWTVGPLSLSAGFDVLRGSANIVAFFLGLMLIAAGAEASGLYERAAALLTARRAGRPQVALVLLLATGITAVLSNDATPLVLTPAIFAAARTRGGDPTAAAFAATFVADGASLLLPISNPVNLLFYDRFDLGFRTFAAEIMPAAAAGIAALSFLTWLMTGRGATARPARAAAHLPASPPIVRAHTFVALATVAALAAAYVAAAMLRVPLGIVSLAGGAAFLGGGLAFRTVEPGRYRRHISLGLLVFVASLLVLVESVSAAGLLDWLSSLLAKLSDQPLLLGVAGAAVVAAVLSNLINNWPAALVLATAIAATPGQPPELIAGALIGCSIGANFTLVGSLSTVFWLSLARKEGANYSAWGYARAAAIPTGAGVAAACAVAALTLR